MVTEFTCSCCNLKFPCATIEFENQTRLSILSDMTADATTNDEETVQGSATVTDASSSSGTSSSGGTVTTLLSKQGKPLWDRTTIYTVEEVYLGNIVEEVDKEVLRKLGKMISKVIFPVQKFLPCWSECLTLSHDEKKDDEERDGQWVHHLFKKMNWETNEFFKPFEQAIKWNTYKHAFIHNFNNYRATNIAKMKKHVIGGKLAILIATSLIYTFTNLSIVYYQS